MKTLSRLAIAFALLAGMSQAEATTHTYFVRLYSDNGPGNCCNVQYAPGCECFPRPTECTDCGRSPCSTGQPLGSSFDCAFSRIQDALVQMAIDQATDVEIRVATGTYSIVGPGDYLFVDPAASATSVRIIGGIDPASNLPSGERSTLINVGLDGVQPFGRILAATLPPNCDFRIERFSFGGANATPDPPSSEACPFYQHTPPSDPCILPDPSDLAARRFHHRRLVATDRRGGGALILGGRRISMIGCNFLWTDFSLCSSNSPIPPSECGPFQERRAQSGAGVFVGGLREHLFCDNAMFEIDVQFPCQFVFDGQQKCRRPGDAQDCDSVTPCQAKNPFERAIDCADPKRPYLVGSHCDTTMQFRSRPAPANNLGDLRRGADIYAEVRPRTALACPENQVCQGVEILNSTFAGKDAINADEGGSVYIDADALPVRIENCRFDGARAIFAGGAVAVRSLGEVTLRRSDFCSCSIMQGKGGAVFCDGSTPSTDPTESSKLTVQDCHFRTCGGFEVSAGGALYAKVARVVIDGDSADKPRYLFDTDPDAIYSTFYNCQAHYSLAVTGEAEFGAGGAAYLAISKSLAMTGATFTKNVAAEGGALRVVASSQSIQKGLPLSLTFLDCVFDQNETRFGAGAALSCNFPGDGEAAPTPTAVTTRFVNSVFRNNLCTPRMLVYSAAALYCDRLLTSPIGPCPGQHANAGWVYFGDIDHDVLQLCGDCEPGRLCPTTCPDLNYPIAGVIKISNPSNVLGMINCTVAGENDINIETGSSNYHPVVDRDSLPCIRTLVLADRMLIANTIFWDAGFSPLPDPQPYDPEQCSGVGLVDVLHRVTHSVASAAGDLTGRSVFIASDIELNPTDSLIANAIPIDDAHRMAKDPMFQDSAGDPDHQWLNISISCCSPCVDAGRMAFGSIDLSSVLPGHDASLALGRRVVPGCFVDIGAIERQDVLYDTDYDQSGVADPDDLSTYITEYFALTSTMCTDINGDGVSDPDDLSDFIMHYFIVGGPIRHVCSPPPVETLCP